MAINLLNMLLLWFKKILAVLSNQEFEQERPASSIPTEEKPLDVDEQHKNDRQKGASVETPPRIMTEKESVYANAGTARPEEQAVHASQLGTPEEKTMLQNPIEATRGSPQKSKGTGDIGGEIESPTQETGEASAAQRPVSVAPKIAKPYKKKPITDRVKKEPIEPPEPKKSQSPPKEKRLIYLGDTQRTRPRFSLAEKSEIDRTMKKESPDTESMQQEFANPVQSPFLELDVDEAKVYLILPAQQFKIDTIENLPRELNYDVQLNGEQRRIPVRTVIDKDRTVFLEAKRISLEKPPERIQIAYPGELQAIEYFYNHHPQGFYVFMAIGNNRGRMCYLHDRNGNVKPLPKRDAWVLIEESLTLQIEPDLIDERWIWERYRPFRVPLSETDALTIYDNISAENRCFPLQSTFYLEGDQLVEDDFKKECPFFAGKNFRIVAPYENQSGWNVWIQHRDAGAQLLSQNWTGDHPLTCTIPDELLIDFGEFQIDICQQNTGIPDQTLFFRLGPLLQLSYPRELVIPDPRVGHTSSIVTLKLDDAEEWELECKESASIRHAGRNSYLIEVPPQEDRCRFSIARTNRSQSTLNFQVTIPRLKWKTSKDQIWGSELKKIDRGNFKSVGPFYLQLRTNDCGTKYHILAILEAKGNSRRLHEAKFIRKGMEYILELNQFRDTVEHYKNDLILRVEIRKMQNPELHASVEALYLEPQGAVVKETGPRQHWENDFFEVPALCTLVKKPHNALRQGRGFSKKEVASAGMSLRELRRLNIPYDRRRNSSHLWNINTLRSLREKYENFLAEGVKDAN